MARASTKTRAGAAPPAAPPGDDLDLDDEQIAPDQAYEDFVADFDPESGGEVSVHREGPGGHKDLEFLRSFSIEEFRPAMLQHPPFNGGKFRIYVRSKNKIRRNFTFRCASLAPAAAPIAAADPNAALAPVLAGMTEGFRLLSAQLATLAKPNGGTDLKQTLELISIAQGLGGGRTANDPLEQFKRFYELQKLVSGDRPPVNADGEVDGGQIMLRAMELFGAPLAKLAEMEIEKRGGKVPAALPAPGGDKPPPAAPAALPTAANEEDEMNIKIAMVKPLLLAVARADADVGPYVEMMLDTFTDEQIAKYINAPDWKTEFLKLMPEASEVMPWFEKLRAGVLEALTPDPDESTISAGGGKTG